MTVRGRREGNATPVVVGGHGYVRAARGKVGEPWMSSCTREGLGSPAGWGSLLREIGLANGFMPTRTPIRSPIGSDGEDRGGLRLLPAGRRGGSRAYRREVAGGLSCSLEKWRMEKGYETNMWVQHSLVF